MEERRTLKQRLLRMHVLTVPVCAIVAIAFARIDFFGHCYSHSGNNEYYAHYLRHGWPTEFAEHTMTGRWPPGAPAFYLHIPFPYGDQLNPLRWTHFRITNVKAAILDISLHLLLIAATAVVVLRLERRRWARLQFSIADMFSLIATTSMVLGLVCLDKVPLVPEIYLRLQTLPPFDCAMVLLAIACAVWLIVSTAANRLGDNYAKKRE
jgi:hypothetical protein